MMNAISYSLVLHWY